MHTQIHNSPTEFHNGLGGKGERQWSLPVTHAHAKHNSPTEIEWIRREKEKGIDHFQPYMHTQNTTHILKLTLDWKKKGRGIRHFQSYMHKQNTTHPLEFRMDWEEKGRSIGYFQLYMHTQNTTHRLKLNGSEGKRERH